VIRRNAAFTVAKHGRFFPPNKNASILEIGPGFGGMIAQLRNGCGYSHVSAVDVSPEVVEACNAVVPCSTVLAPDTTQFLQEHSGEFDLILMLHVLEHVPKEQIIPLLKSARAALTEGGKLVVEVPNIAHPVSGAYNRYHDFTHTVGFTDQSLAFVLRNAGFANVTVYGCKTVTTNPARLMQRVAQDMIEFFSGLLLRAYLPNQPVNLSTALGACATE
jgi:2-polyprenyl-3-methyl-5-hydroxy-6-metoxy-1,4-benzoquinol methylase